MRCPICNKSFDFEVKMLEHFEEHKKTSELGIFKPTKTGDSTTKKENKAFNKTKLLWIETFESSASEKLDTIKNVEHLVSGRTFIEQIKEITVRFPFAYVPSLVTEWFHGTYGPILIEKYHLDHHMNLKHIFEKTFKFKNKRYTGKIPHTSYEKNLKIFGWEDKLQEINRNCILFKQEIDMLFFKNTLRAFILMLMMDYEKQGIDKLSLIEESKKIDEHYDLFRFIDDDLKLVFNKISHSCMGEVLNEIIDELILEKILKLKDSSLLRGHFSLDTIKQKIISVLKYNANSLSEYQLKRNIKIEFPGLDFVPDSVIWNAVLNELEEKNIIKISQRSNFGLSSLVFLNEDYDRILQQIKNMDSGDVKFYGRNISPEAFVDELLDLETGDIDDHDDQVTRIAGLILAESVKIIPPKEKLPEFDFAVDVTKYAFRQEQIDAMKKLNFRIASEIIHVRVMIDVSLTLEKYMYLREKIPENEQAVIITFEKIPTDVQKLIEIDPILQIIDEEGIKTWVSITPKIPARVGSISKIHSDPLSKLQNKIVKINSVFYEEGIALVSVLPDMDEATVLARSLEEIPLFEDHPSNFQTYSDNYLEFLQIMSVITTNDLLVRGISENESVENLKRSKTKFEMKFDYGTVKLDLEENTKNHILRCDCLRYAENNLELCEHLISSLDYMFRHFSYGNKTWNGSNKIKTALELIIKENIVTVLDRLGVVENHGVVEGDKRVHNFVLEVLKIRKSF